ncbi:MAG: hypothetical protein GY765_38815 [bacterium]|nr:hypothetical protein [bacterium]
MKKRNTTKKLAINKTTISNLAKGELSTPRGGQLGTTPRLCGTDFTII